MHMTSRARTSTIVLALLSGAAGCVPAPHSFKGGPLPGGWRVAILPLANYTATREAPDRVLPMLAEAVGRQPGIQVVDPGEVQAVLSNEPWLLLDRVPPDLVDRFGRDLKANALLMGSILGYGFRDVGGEHIPQLSLSLRLVETPGGRVLWTSVHSRDGADNEWLFGLGRVLSLEQLASAAVREMMVEFPVAGAVTPVDSLTPEMQRRESVARRGNP